MIFGVTGDEGRLEYAIIGDPVNRAAKLRNQTKVEGVRGLARVDCRDTAMEQGYRPSQAHAVLADRPVSGVSGVVSLVVLGDAGPGSGAIGPSWSPVTAVSVVKDDRPASRARRKAPPSIQPS